MDYGSVWERGGTYHKDHLIYVQKNIQYQTSGFDGVYDQGAGTGGRGTLAFGLYKIQIIREEETVFTFYIDIRENDVNDDYYNLSYDYLTGTMTADAGIPGDQHKFTFFAGDTIKRWELHDVTKDWAPFTQDIPVTNYVGGTADNSLKVELTDKAEGFPVLESEYPVGYQFYAGENVPFWKEATYGFKALTEITNGYRMRDWNGADIGQADNYKLKQADTKVVANYYPTDPL